MKAAGRPGLGLIKPQALVPSSQQPVVLFWYLSSVGGRGEGEGGLSWCNSQKCTVESSPPWHLIKYIPRFVSKMGFIVMVIIFTGSGLHSLSNILYKQLTGTFTLHISPLRYILLPSTSVCSRVWCWYQIWRGGLGGLGGLWELFD